MKKTYIILICVVLLLSACGKKGEVGKNMEQIQREQGIPVRVRTVEAGTFTQELNYSATLGGREESTAQAMVSDIVTSIKAKVGDRVTAGQIIVTFPQNTPAAQYVQASAAFNAQKQAYERMQRLFSQGAIARQDLDNLETGYNVAKANLEAAEKMINVRAPISGVITKIMVNPAERTYPGQDLFTVSSTNGFKATLMIPDTDVSKLRVGTPATAKWIRSDPQRESQPNLHGPRSLHQSCARGCRLWRLQQKDQLWLRCPDQLENHDQEQCHRS